MSIKKGLGLTPSEEILADLGEKTFLGLWSYANVYKSPGQELCDLLAVCGDDIIVFSDKNIDWSHDDIKIGWPRWYKKAVKKSADQIAGAIRWISEHEDRIFLDAACKTKFPFELPPLSRRRVHGVCVALGAESAAAKYFSDPDGTCFIVPHLKGNDHVEFDLKGHIPFAIGDVDPDKAFVHVFNQTSLSLVMHELDTITDFVDYLSAREKFIRSGNLTLSPSEAELIANYLQTMKDDKHAFPIAEDAGGTSDYQVTYMQGEYAHFVASPEYRNKKDADKISYAWDTLIQQFTHHVISGTSHKILEIEPDAVLAERALRIMARETRFARRLLGGAFVGAVKSLHDQKEKDRLARVLMPTKAFSQPNLAYVFMALSREPFEDYETYRAVRASMLETYCLSILHDHREIETCVGIAIDALSNDGSSEDLIATQQLPWTDEEVKQLAEAREGYEILVNPSAIQPVMGRFREYPVRAEPNGATRQQRRAAERAAKKASKRRWSST